MATKAQEILSKHDHGFQKSKEEHEKVVEKAKTHTAKVQESVEQLKARKAKELETKKAEILEKAQKAEDKRQQNLSKVVETATMLYQKRSPSIDQAVKDVQSEAKDSQNWVRQGWWLIIFSFYACRQDAK